VDASKRMNLQEMLEHEFLSATPLPKQIPVSTLVTPPTDNFASAYLLPDISKMKQNGAMFSP
jgi:hypothetical protein